MKRILFTILLLMVSILSYAQDKTITICSYEWPPHHGTTMMNEGYTAQIIREIFETRGYRVNKMFLPWARAQSYAKEGKKCDAITEIYFNEPRLEFYWYGMPYTVHEVYLIGLKTNPENDYDSLRDLAQYIFGHNRAGSLSKEFDAADFLQKQETDGYKNGIEMLLNNRIYFFVSAKSVAFYEAGKLGGRDKIKTVDEPLQRQYVHMAFSKKNPDNLFRLQDYNEGLYMLLRSGRYKEIMREHRIE
ncbi:substrate-binding periplasmic protein [Solemya velesiana gill symbiont]|nr:transporter substrate-binding domain-containing protein [Solemya velesiana gill symbiont]